MPGRDICLTRQFKLAEPALLPPMPEQMAEFAIGALLLLCHQCVHGGYVEAAMLARNYLRGKRADESSFRFWRLPA